MDKNTERLVNLISKNPELPVIPMVSAEVVCDDSYDRWVGSVGLPEIKEYTTYEFYGDGEEIIYREDCDSIKEYIADHYDKLTDEEIEKMIDFLEWKKAIFLNVDLPNY